MIAWLSQDSLDQYLAKGVVAELLTRNPRFSNVSNITPKQVSDFRTTAVKEIDLSRVAGERPEEEDAWLRFLYDEGLEVLAAYRSIENVEVRAMFVRLMKDAARQEREANKGLN